MKLHVNGKMAGERERERKKKEQESTEAISRLKITQCLSVEKVLLTELP